VIVENKDFKYGVVTIGQGTEARTKTEFLVACGYENRDLGWRVDDKVNRWEAEHLEIQKVITGDEKEAEKDKKVKEINHRH